MGQEEGVKHDGMSGYHMITVRKQWTTKGRVDVAAKFLPTDVGAAEICRKRGVPPATFGGWRRRFMEAGRMGLAGGGNDPARALARERKSLRIVAAGQALAIDETKKSWMQGRGTASAAWGTGGQAAGRPADPRPLGGVGAAAAGRSGMLRRPSSPPGIGPAPAAALVPAEPQALGAARRGAVADGAVGRRELFAARLAVHAQHPDGLPVGPCRASPAVGAVGAAAVLRKAAAAQPACRRPRRRGPRPRAPSSRGGLGGGARPGARHGDGVLFGVGQVLLDILAVVAALGLGAARIRAVPGRGALCRELLAALPALRGRRPGDLPAGPCLALPAVRAAAGAPAPRNAAAAQPTGGRLCHCAARRALCYKVG